MTINGHQSKLKTTCMSSASSTPSTVFPQLFDGISATELTNRLVVGDVVFIRVTALPFRMVANATACWANHVGIVMETSCPQPMIAESTFPVSKATPLSRFVNRSEQGRVEVRRLNSLLTIEQQNAIQMAAKKRLGIFYDTGFNLYSKRQFCSRYVRDVLAEAVGIQLGEVERFSAFLATTSPLDLTFWRLWYFGKIPLHRQTVTPASLLSSPALHTVFTGYVDHQLRFLDKSGKASFSRLDDRSAAK